MLKAIGAMFACGALMVPTMALAWGDEGHEIVALIAQGFLTPQTTTKVNALLASDNDMLTHADIASRATWADKFRDFDRNGAKLHYNATRQWHFVDMEIGIPDLNMACFNHPKSVADKASEGPAQNCIVDKIDEFRAELVDSQISANEKLLAFKFLLHFVGDIHQPLHAADHHDAGGNSVKILFGNRKVATNLHGYWDTTLVELVGKDPQQVADQLSSEFRNRQQPWSAGNAQTWARESFKEAHDVAYHLPARRVKDAHGDLAYRLGPDYENDALPLVKEQLAKAGIRLAAVLNAALK